MSNKIILILCLVYLSIFTVSASTDQYNLVLIIPDNTTSTPTPTPTPLVIVISGGGGGGVTSQNPPEVFIQLIDKILPTIELSINIKNEGLYAYEYKYVWTLYQYTDNVPVVINRGASSKYLKSGESLSIPLEFELTEGAYELTTDITWSTYKSFAGLKFDVQSSIIAAKKQITKRVNENILIVLGIVILIFISSVYFIKK